MFGVLLEWFYFSEEIGYGALGVLPFWTDRLNEKPSHGVYSLSINEYCGTIERIIPYIEHSRPEHHIV